MRDPERLLRRPRSELTARLLEAGGDEKPSAESLRRTLKVAAVSTAIGASLHSATAGAAALGAKSALASVAGGVSTAATSAAGSGVALGAGVAAGVGAAGVGAAGVGAAGVGAGASVGAGNAAVTITALAIAKWVGVGAVGGVVAASAAHRLAPTVFEATSARTAPAASIAALQSQRAQRPPTRRFPGVTPAPLAEAAAPAVLDAPALDDAATNAVPPLGATPPVIATPVTPEATSPRASSPVAAPAARTSSTVPEPVLAAEVAFVDRGRAALQSGDGSGALRALAGYEAAFPKRQLLPEVLFLRMEACSRSGDHEQARALAQRIVGSGAMGPQSARARDILAH